MACICEAAFVQRHRQDSLWHTRCHGVSGRNREKQNHEFILGFLTSSKTAPHLWMGWLFESWKIFVVLTHFSTTNYCKDYFGCRAYSHFASLHRFCRLFGQICGDGPLVEMMWVQMFLRCIHRYHAGILPYMSHRGTEQTSKAGKYNLRPTVTLLGERWKSHQKKVPGLDCESQKKTGRPYTRPPKQLVVIITGLLLLQLWWCTYSPVQRECSYLLHCWYSPVGWPDSRASPERDTGSLCVLLSFRRAKLGRSAVEYGTCACCAAS